MHKSIQRDFFTLCIAVLASGLIIMSSAVIGYSVSRYKSDRHAIIERIAGEIEKEFPSYGTDYDKLGEMFGRFSGLSEVNFVLFDRDGRAIACSASGGCPYKDRLLPRQVIINAADGHSEELGTLGGFFEKTVISCIDKTFIDGEDHYLLGYMSAEGMFDYLWSKITIAVGVFLALMLFMVPLLKYNIKRLFGPIEEMTVAAKRFGEGDFSEKVKVMESNELGLLANTLNEMASSLEATEENRKSFISNVSHELRTPMTTIGGFVGGILDGTIPENMHKQYLRTVSEEIDRLARLVRSMLNISKYEAGELKLQTDDFDITALTVKTVLLFEKRIEGKNLDIRGLDSDRFFVNADKDLIQQVIFNLTENAVKFVNEGGYISYGFRAEDGKIFVAIRNSGEGLKKNEMNKVFDRFYKTDESRGKDKTGVGLGLSIVRSIIKLHEGSVLVRSVEGEYTEFEFSVPEGVSPAGLREQ